MSPQALREQLLNADSWFLAVPVGHGRCALPDGGHADSRSALKVAGVALLVFALSAQQLVIEMPSEALAQQVQGKWVHAGAGEAQHSRHKRDDEV